MRFGGKGRNSRRFTHIHFHYVWFEGERRERLSMFSLRGIGEKVREINYFPLVGYINLHLGPHFSLLFVLFLLFSILSNQMN